MIAKKTGKDLPVQAKKAQPAIGKAMPDQAGKVLPAGDKAMQFAFGKENYRLMLIGLAVIALGFILMVGGGSDDPAVFNEGMFNFQRLTLAPMLILAGYVIGIFAIMKKPRD